MLLRDLSRVKLTYFKKKKKYHIHSHLQMNESGENNVCCVVIQLRTSDTSIIRTVNKRRDLSI